MRKDDKGFTLLELLVAVIVLAIIIVPMLHSFATSYRVNARSREFMRATTLAQNEMEIFEREKIEDLVDPAKFDYDVHKRVDTSDLGTDDEMDHIAYTFSRSGIINDESGRDMFDVVVKLDPESASPSDLYFAENTQQLLYMNTLSGADSGAYVQRVRSMYTDGEDEEVYKIYQNRQIPEGITGSTWGMDDFAKELTRKITVTIEQVDQGDFVSTVAKVNYQYHSGYGQVPVEYQDYSTGDKVIFNNASTLDEEGNVVELQSIYLFYAPRYWDDDGTPKFKDDEIIIENKDKLPINIYIIRQNIRQDPDDEDSILGVYTDDSGHEWNKVPDDYKVTLRIHEGFVKTDEGLDKETCGKYFTNLNLGLPGISGKGITEIKLYDVDSALVDSPKYDNTAEAIKYTNIKSLGSTEAKDRIYTMKVAVYTHDADVVHDDPLVELTGTKIE